jgi:cell division protein FtsQ
LRGEGVITQQRAGRGEAKSAAKRTSAAAQRPAGRRARPQQQPLARAKGGGLTWKRALTLVPLALKLLLAVAFGLLVFVGYQQAASASFFKVRKVDVAGERRASRADIEATVARSASEGVWRADLEEISRRVRQIPWVRSAVVTRVLPGDLRVRVTEREPRVIARNAAGRFVWVDDEGVVLGPADPDGQEFTVRGLDETGGEAARRANSKRVALALELKREWERANLSGRVSEVNLEDLNDVRVQLAGADAGLEVRLGGGVDHVKLFADAVKVLDRERDTPLGRHVTYIVMRPGKAPVFGYPPQARAAAQGPAAGTTTVTPPAAPARAAATPTPARRGAAAPTPKREERERPRDAGNRQTGAAVRPRRAG